MVVMKEKANQNTNKKKIYWRCRRGTRELDRMVLSFLNKDFEESSLECQSTFADLLELPDPELHDILTGQVLIQDANLLHITKCITKNTEED